MAIIRIGAEELILWMRKNGKAAQDNRVLGRKILDYIKKELDGQKVEANVPSCWVKPVDDANDIHDLPDTSAQYEIDSSQLEVLFLELERWQ